MSIGEFAQLTGISAKALRHYDETGVLRPAEVEPGSRYRRYGVDQIAPAMTVRALRQARMPLAAAGDVLAGGDTAARALRRHRDRLAAERVAQDRAMVVLESGDAAAAWPVEVRDVAAQHWAGAVLPLGDVVQDVSAQGDEGAPDDDGVEGADEVFAALWRALDGLGLRPTAPPWSSFRSTGSEEAVELLCCWPLAAAAPDGWSPADLDVVRGVVPAGAQLLSRWSDGDGSSALPGGLHPAVVAVLVEADRRGADVRLEDLRQVVVPGDDHDPGGIEITVALGAARR